MTQVEPYQFFVHGVGWVVVPTVNQLFCNQCETNHSFGNRQTTG